jgi:hypothetical protein
VAVGGSIPIFLSGTDCADVVEVFGREGVQKSVLFVMRDAVLDDTVRNVVDGLGYPFELDLPHLDGLKEQFPKHLPEFLSLLPILSDNQLVHLFLNRKDSRVVILNIHKDFRGIFIDLL